MIIGCTFIGLYCVLKKIKEDNEIFKNKIEQNIKNTKIELNAESYEIKQLTIKYESNGISENKYFRSGDVLKQAKKDSKNLNINSAEAKVEYRLKEKKKKPSSAIGYSKINTDSLI